MMAQTLRLLALMLMCSVATGFAPHLGAHPRRLLAQIFADKDVSCLLSELEDIHDGTAYRAA